MHPFRTHKAGFTLIEMMVAVGIFAVVMVIALGALLNMAEADRRSQTFKSVINNLNFALDSMSRSIRTGTDYNCGSAGGGDCDGYVENAGEYISFISSDGAQVEYQKGPGGDGHCSNCIERRVNSGSWLALTATEVVISNLKFYVIGSVRGDTIQPKVTMLLSGYVQVTATQQSRFDLQTSVTQRLYDK